jgi:uncharacterized damage-inducible protein DinB
MNKNCIQNLNEIRALLEKISHQAYNRKSGLLSEATIGQHVRHILEFYICLINAAKTKIVNYDNRQRDLSIENSKEKAIEIINKIIDELIQLNTPSVVILQGRFNPDSEDLTSMKTSYARELAYCLEHSIHHQALIKIALKEQNIMELTGSDFGVAPATIRYKQLSLQNC